MAQANWQGASGRVYTYGVYPLNADWDDVPGNYIFARWVGGRWVAIYIGQTSSFKDRLPTHEVWPCARRNGVTHIHAHTESNVVVRLAEERDLLANNNPPCNG